MAKLEWMSVLGWNERQLEDIRYLAYSYVKVGKYDYALTIFEALTVLNPQSIYDLQMLGALYLELGNTIKALNILEKSLKMDPNHLPTKLNKVKAMYMLGYKEPATLEAKALTRCANQQIANTAEALILSYT